MTETLRPRLEAAMDEFFRASALFEQVRLRMWDSEGLTVTQLRLLYWVGEDEGLSNADLADRLYVTRPSVSALLDRLERGGFIRREISPSDRRGICIWLQERGRNAVAHLTKESREFTRRLMEGLSDQDLEDMQVSLAKMVAVGVEARQRDLRASDDRSSSLAGAGSR